MSRSDSAGALTTGGEPSAETRDRRRWIPSRCSRVCCAGRSFLSLDARRSPGRDFRHHGRRPSRTPAHGLAGRNRLTYAEVEATGRCIGRGLNARGVGPGDVVGLWMTRGDELLIAQIAIAKSGAAWLPFDADAPVDRVATCLADARGQGAADRRRACRSGPAGPRSRSSYDRRRLRQEGSTVDPRALGLHAGPSRLHDLHVRLDGRAEGHRRQPAATSAITCASANELYGLPATTSCSRARRWPSTSRWRRSGCPISSARPCGWRRPK